MKQVIRKGLKDIIVDEVPDPVVTPHHVLVHPIYSLISSGTETASIHQESIVKEVADNPSHVGRVLNVMKLMGPLKTFNEVKAKMFSDYAVLGYSGAGYVVDKHPTVNDIQIGDRVSYGGEGTGHGEAILTGRNLVAQIPDEVPFQHACFATLGSIAMNSVRISEVQLGEYVAVIGLGLVGQLVAQLATAQGARVIATDLRPERVQLAGELGAEHAIVGGAHFYESVMSITNGRGVDCVYIAAAAKSSAPCELALQICRDRGRIVVVGAVDMSFPWGEMYMKEIKLLMSRAYGPGSYDPAYERKGQDYPLPYVRWTENRNMSEFLRLIARGAVRVQPLITHEYPLERASEAYQTIMTPGSSSLAVLLEYPAAKLPDPVSSFQAKRKVDLAIPGDRRSDAFGVAVVGAGNLAKWEHLPLLKKIAGVELRAVHSTSGARGKGYAQRFGAAYCCTDYDEILQDPKVDAILIATRNAQHAAESVAALRAGKHVFVEKPMALTIEECRDLYRAVEESGKHLTVGFNRRFAPYYVGLKDALKKRVTPAVVSCRVNSPGISGSFWMADPSIGGAILGEACHFVDLMYWLLDSEPVELMAYCLPTGKQDPIGENNMAATFRFADGSVGSIAYCTVGSKTSGGELVEVFAQGIGASSEDFKRLEIKGGSRRKSSKLFADKGYKEQLESFVARVRGGQEPEITVVDGARATIGCVGMLESARTLQPFRMDTLAMIRASERTAQSVV
jgi:predicted dehydrogenase